MAKQTVKQYFDSLNHSFFRADYFTAGVVLRRTLLSGFGRASDKSAWGNYVLNGNPAELAKGGVNLPARATNIFSWPFFLSGGLRATLWSAIDYASLGGKMLRDQPSPLWARGLKAIIGVVLLPLEIPSFFLSKASDVVIGAFQADKKADAKKPSISEASKEGKAPSSTPGLSKTSTQTKTPMSAAKIESHLRESALISEPSKLTGPQSGHGFARGEELSATKYLDNIQRTLDGLTDDLLMSSRDPRRIIKNLEENRKFIRDTILVDRAPKALQEKAHALVGIINQKLKFLNDIQANADKNAQKRAELASSTSMFSGKRKTRHGEENDSKLEYPHKRPRR